MNIRDVQFLIDVTRHVNIKQRHVEGIEVIQKLHTDDQLNKV